MLLLPSQPIDLQTSVAGPPPVVCEYVLAHVARGSIVRGSPTMTVPGNRNVLFMYYYRPLESVVDRIPKVSVFVKVELDSNEIVFLQLDHSDKSGTLLFPDLSLGQHLVVLTTYHKSSTGDLKKIGAFTSCINVPQIDHSEK